MLRTVRFSAQLGFGVEAETLRAVRELAPLAASLSAERVRDELIKTLRSPRPELAWQLVDLGLLRAFLLTGDWNAPRPALRSLPLYARLARFCLGLEQCGYIMSTASLLAALRFDGDTQRTAAAAVEVLKSRQPGLEAAFARLRPRRRPCRTAEKQGTSGGPALRRVLVPRRARRWRQGA